MIPSRGGYPYMNIAKQYGVNYTDVLLVADWLTYERELPGAIAATGRLPGACHADIVAMRDEYRVIQREGWA